MKDPAQGKSGQESQSIASDVSGKSAGYPAPVQRFELPVAQLQLELGQTYKAKSNVPVFSTGLKKKTDARLTKNHLYAVVYITSGGKARLRDKTTKAIYYLADGNDAEFEAVAPRLEQSDEKALLNDPESTDYVDFYDPGYTPKTPQQTELSEGNVGDCWLMGPMLSMAQSPQWKDTLKNDLKNNTAQETYDVDLFKFDKTAKPDDKLTPHPTQELSGYLPVIPKSQSNTHKDETLYGQYTQELPKKFTNDPKSAPLLPAFLEKGYAQIEGGYGKLDDRSAQEGLSVLSGQMPRQIVLKTTPLDNVSWAMLIDELSKGGAINLTTKKNSDGPPETMYDGTTVKVYKAKSYKLVEDHVYTVKAITLTDIELLNPHGSNHPMKMDMNAVNDFFTLVDYLPHK